MKCTHCTAETSDGIALCKRCMTTAERALENIAAYHADLDLIPTDGDQRRRSNTTPDPTGIAASEIVIDPVSAADADATNTLTTWARCLVDDRPRAGRPPVGVPNLAAWLSGHLPSIVTLDWAGAMLRDLVGLERLLKRVAARARTGQYLGTCGHVVTEARPHDGTTCACACHLGRHAACDVPGGCGAEYATIGAEVCDRALYAARDDHWVRCRCGATWDARARRQLLVRAAEDVLAPVSVIAQLVATFSGEASVGQVEARIRKWVERDRIRATTSTVIGGRKRKVYRVGDVLDLLVDTPNPEVESRAG